MAANEPRGMGGFEELLMDVVSEECNTERKFISNIGSSNTEASFTEAVSEESNAERKVIPCNASSNTDASFTDSETLGLEVPQCYAIDMDISETMGSLKRMADEALSSDVLNFNVTVLSDKQLSDSETLQQLCGTDSGLVRIQFVLCRDTKGDRLDILDVLMHENDITPVSTNEPIMLEQRLEKFKIKCDRIINFMKYGQSALLGMNYTETRNIKNASKTHLWDGEKEELFYIGGKDGVKKKVITSVDEVKGIMRLYHPNPDGSHTGINRTLAKVSQSYLWNGMREDISGYIKRCEQCQREKSLDHSS